MNELEEKKEFTAGELELLRKEDPNSERFFLPRPDENCEKGASDNEKGI